MAIENEKMGPLAEQTMPEKAHQERIIDLDFHLHIPYTVLIPYIEDDYIRDMVDRCGAPPTSGPKTMSISYAKNKRTKESHDRVHGIAATSDEIREVCDELAIDVPVVQPGTNLPLHRSNYPTVANELTRAYNDFLIDKVIDVDNEIYANIMIPQWDVGLAVEELERLGNQEGIVAAHNWLTSAKLWGDKQYDPIFEKLSELDLNLVLHVTSGQAFGPKLDRESTQTYSEQMVYGYGYHVMANAINMVMSGVFDKFPDLKVSLQEAGSMWIPWAAYRTDEEYQSYPGDLGLSERRFEEDKRSLDRMPSEYFFENLYAATQPSAFANVHRSSHIEGLLKACRAGKTFQYTSDWPHLTLDPVKWLYDTPAIDRELRHRILHKNAEEFLRL
jgi:predicted TIM-barrel fold metal-dependent hydrolase